MMLTPQRAFTLPEWREADLVGWGALAERAFRIATRAGTGGRFRRVIDEVRRLIEQEQFEEIDRRLTERSFARALVTVWHDDQRLAFSSLTTARVSALLDAHQSGVTRLTTVTLIAVILRYFDHLDTWQPGLLAGVASAASRAVESQTSRNGQADLVEAFRRDHVYLTRHDGPTRLAENLVLDDVPLDDYLRLSGLLGFDGGRFGDRLRHAYYIAQIGIADHTLGHHSFLREVSSRNVAEAPGRDGLYFGHEVLEALADKPGEPPSDEWLGAIIDLGGDPRLKGTSKWRTWWQPLSERARDQVIRWLSVEDLRLFLMAVENFGRDEDVDDLARLFPPRKKFLWGLYNSGVIRETRLILGRNVRESVRGQVTKVRTDIALYQSNNDTAIIYVDCGDFHLVEGSHNFRLWTYAGRPVPMLPDRSKRTFTSHEFIYEIPGDHSKKHPDGWDGHLAVTHKGLWQRRPLEFLIEEHGIDLDPAKLLTPDDYHELKYKHGLPVRGSSSRRW